MRTVFADACYWVALANSRDSLHEKALEVCEEIGNVRIVTTDEVLMELLNFYSEYPDFREIAVRVVKEIMANPNVEVVPQTRKSFMDGLFL